MGENAANESIWIDLLKSLGQLVRDYGLAVTIVIAFMVGAAVCAYVAWRFFRYEVWPWLKDNGTAMKDRSVKHLDHLDSCTETMSRSLSTLDDTLGEIKEVIRSQTRGLHRQADAMEHLTSAVQTCPGSPEMKDRHVERAKKVTQIDPLPPIDPPERITKNPKPG